MNSLLKPRDMGLTPARIVEELNRYIIGQFEAKKAVAIALRNRYRRKCLSSEMALEVVPKNILMIGPTGVGKTEVARRLARLAGAPFIKVEATKFTEVGYVGRDVESIIRDLVEMSVQTHKAKAKERVLKEVESLVIDRILDAIVGKHATEGSREKFASRILSGELDDTEIEIEVQENTSPMGGFEIPGMPGAAMGFLNIGEMIGKNFGSTRTKTRKLKVKQAKELIISEESEKLVDQEKVVEEAINSVENDGIVFLDEVDKLCSSSDRASTPSREGVQRDLLPLIEGTNVATRYGTVATDHILFIASGAFHLAKPSDLLPELQGRLPIRVELSPLTKEDLVRILVEPESSLIKQYVALIATEGIDLKFTDAAIDKIATYAMNFNSEIEDIGARRLHTVMEKLLEEISYNASDLNLENITVDIETVEERLSVAVKDQDLKRFIL